MKVDHHVLLVLLMLLVAQQAVAAPPNVVIFLIDDMGYADIGPFGCTKYPTPNLDRLAEQGEVFTDFHAASAVCSESRAALLTGCYPGRVSIHGALFPGDRRGIHPNEITLGELCQSRGYATGCFGKWHLGSEEEFLPTRHGFDHYFGLLYSNDMWRYRYGQHDLSEGEKKHRGKKYPPLQLWDDEQVVVDEVTPDHQKQLTTQCTEHAVSFIEKHAGKQPFFCYVPHSMVHVPLYVSEKFAGKSNAGIYGDVVMELDWSVGEVLAALKRTGVEENTLVVFTSDNGPWLRFGSHGGSAGPLREGKSTMFEGGHRVPCVMRWPERIKPGSRCDELCMQMDLLPTIAKLIGAELPSDRVIDGQDILPLMTDPNAKSPHEVMYCYIFKELRAIRDSRWKLVFPHTYRVPADAPPKNDGVPVRNVKQTTGLELYDLQNDIGEETDLSGSHPEVVNRLMQHAEEARSDLGDLLTDRTGNGIRPNLRLPRPGQ